MIRRPPRPPLFPYTTLSRPPTSRRARREATARLHPPPARGAVRRSAAHRAAHRGGVRLDPGQRSEEHTSELQSLAYLVCRLLLEKKKREPLHLALRHLPAHP